MNTNYQNYTSEQFISEIVNHKSEITKQENRITQLEEDLAWFRKQIFGKKSEKHKTLLNVEEQALIPFENVEVLQANPSEEITVTYKRKKKKKNEDHPGRNVLPAHLERVDIDVFPEGDLSKKKLVGTRIREVLDRTPAKFFVTRYLIHTYQDIVTRELSEGKTPSLPIEKGIPCAGLLAFILVNKFVYHLPLHRQLEIFKNEAGMIIKASTISGWVGMSAKLLLILYHKLLERVLKESYLMVDETPIKVLMKKGKNKIILGYFWVYYSPLTKTVFFDYRSGRGGENPSYRLKNFKGHIQVDGYVVYKGVAQGDIDFLNCMAHARRYFVDAKKNHAAFADHFLNEVQKLYRVEKSAKRMGLSHEDRFKFRILKSEPVLTNLKIWLDANVNKTTPSMKIGEAMRYSINHWEGLIKYLTDGKFEIDNNPVERAIRPVAIGRKNYMFAGSEEGAKNLAIMYSFFGTCRAQGIEPYEWMKDVLEKMPDFDPKLIEELLPIHKPVCPEA